jgi:Fe-S-cluster containining protein
MKCEMNKGIEKILKDYGTLLDEVDSWFKRCLEEFPAKIACRSGCSECCRGLFDITLLDACYLKSGFDRLPDDVREHVTVRAIERVKRLQELWPEFAAPFILNYRPDEEWEELMPEEDGTPCSLLGADGKCLVYDYRPMTCRLNGVPLVDVSSEVFFDEWCTLNFKKENPLELPKLRWEFNTLFRKELLIFREFTSLLLNKTFNELDTFIPTALLLDFKGFDWRRWVRQARLVKSAIKD